MTFEESVKANKDTKTGVVEPFCVRQSPDPRKQQDSLAYFCQASTAEVRAKWIHSLRKLQQTQKNLLDALYQPITHQNNLDLDPL